jgi:hypothetical protein
MADTKLTANQVRRIEEIQGFITALAHVKKLVLELESSRAARVQVIQGISSQIAREFSQMRQRAIRANIGTLADVAGSLSLTAGRSQGLQMKLRILHEGIVSLGFQLDHALKDASTPEKKPSQSQTPPE